MNYSDKIKSVLFCVAVGCTRCSSWIQEQTNHQQKSCNRHDWLRHPQFSARNFLWRQFTNFLPCRSFDKWLYLKQHRAKFCKVVLQKLLDTERKCFWYWHCNTTSNWPITSAIVPPCTVVKVELKLICCKEGALKPVLTEPLKTKLPATLYRVLNL